MDMQEPNERTGDLHILDLLILVGRHRRLIAGSAAAFAALAAVAVVLMTPVYTATARILPPQPPQSAALAALGQLGAAAGMGASFLGIKNPSDLYVGMLTSDTVADRLAERFGLGALYGERTQVDTREALRDVTEIRAGKDGIISIAVDDEDPARAAALANAYVEELDKVSQTLAITEAAQRRLFFENQLRASKDDLARAELGLRSSQEASGLIQLEEQAKAMIAAAAGLRAQIVMKEAEIASLRTFATVTNPDYLRATQQLARMQEEYSELLRRQAMGKGGKEIGASLLPMAQLPEAGLEYVRRMRDVKYHETLFELLARQFELAKIDEAKDAAVIQVLDRARPPDKKARPKSGLVIAASTLLGALLAVLVAVLLEGRKRVRADPRHAERVAQLGWLFRRAG